MRLSVSELVLEEVAGIARWHQNQPARLGGEFLDAFDLALAEIEATPYLFGVANDSRIGHEDREYYLKRFKQRIIYYVVAEEVRVIAVVHASRNPGIWHLQADHEEHNRPRE
jgi:hypothetical protein